jgi:hypothetical protein
MTVKDIIDKLNSGASRISLGLCANGGCFHQRRRGRIKSQFCQECSDKHNRKDEYSEGAAYTATPNIAVSYTHLTLPTILRV